MTTRPKKKKMEKSGQEVIRPANAVELSLWAPEAKEVFLAGEFNQWDTQSIPMNRGKDGNWKVKMNLPAGRYEYKFFLDSRWVEDTPGAEHVLNCFGTQNYVLEVG